MGRAQNVASEAVSDGADETVDADADQPTADDAWASSLRAILHDVIAALPDHATLGELIAAASSNPSVAPVLDIFTVQELIDIARARPKGADSDAEAGPGSADPAAVTFDADGNPIMDLDSGPKVIRRRADVPDGDVRVLRCLAERGPQRESELGQQTKLTAEQLRIIVRHLRTKGYIHVEGSGTKRKLKITRNGSSYVRRQR